MSRLVLMEAKILEVTLDDGFQTGINWAQLGNYKGTNFLTGQIGNGSMLNDGLADLNNKEVDMGARLSDVAMGVASSTLGGVFTLAIQGEKFSAFVEMLESQGDVRTLSNPRIATLNNQKAVIKVGGDQFFVTDVSTTTQTAGTSSTSSPTIELTPFFSGIVLDVTPQISGQDEVILHIHPSVTHVEDQTKRITLDDKTQELPLALSQVRESDSIVRARSGQVVVIGGLMQNSQTDRDAGIPFIRRIPFLGKLFTHTQLANHQSELVILLRPIVVHPGGWNERLHTTGGRFGRLKGARDEDPGRIGSDDWLRPIPQRGR